MNKYLCIRNSGNETARRLVELLDSGYIIVSSENVSDGCIEYILQKSVITWEEAEYFLGRKLVNRNFEELY